MQEVHTVLPNGSLVRDRYVVEHVLGKGGFGAVYLVRDLRVQGNQFALKELIHPNKRERERLAFEGEVLKRLDHRALPRVYRVFEDDTANRAYLLMDYIAGPNLEVLRQQQPERRFSPALTMKIMAPIIDAVSYLHEQKPPIIHRDIKPANIIVPAGGENAVLVDFGIAKEYEQDATTTAVRHGSPGYGAPEQYSRGTNLRTDVYGLAATFYALLTGTIPVDALARMAQLGNHGTDPLVPVNQLAPEVPTWMAEAIGQAMAINSNERFVSVRAFWQALQVHPLEDTALSPLAPRPQTIPSSRESTTKIAALPTAVIHKPLDTRSSKRRVGVPILLVLIALAALLIGVSLGMQHLFSTHQSSATATHNATATHATSKPTVKSTVPSPVATTAATHVPAKQTPVQQSTPTSQPTSPSATYPLLKGAYSGTIHNDLAGVDTSLALSQIRQSGAAMSGYLTVGPTLQGSGNFTGMVSTDKSVRFLVQSYHGFLPLLFNGQMNADGSLSGSYCSARNNQCDYNGGGYGTWKVFPSSLGS